VPTALRYAENGGEMRVTMRSRAELIAEYLLGDSGVRQQLVDEFENHHAEEVIDILIRGILDKREDVYVRLSILQSLPFREDSAPLRGRVANALCKILLREDDPLIRQHAGLALRAFVECPAVLDVLEAFVQNLSEEVRIRENALAAIEFTAYGSAECRDRLNRLVDHPEFGQSIRDLLTRIVNK